MVEAADSGIAIPLPGGSCWQRFEAGVEAGVLVNVHGDHLHQATAMAKYIEVFMPGHGRWQLGVGPSIPDCRSQFLNLIIIKKHTAGAHRYVRVG